MIAAMTKIDTIREMAREFHEAKAKGGKYFFLKGRSIEAKSEGMGYIETTIGKHAISDLIIMEDDTRERILSKIK